MMEDKVRSKSIDDGKYNYDPVLDDLNSTTNENYKTFLKENYAEDTLFKENPQSFLLKTETKTEINEILDRINLLEKSLTHAEQIDDGLKTHLRKYLKNTMEDFRYERENHILKINTDKIYPTLFTKLDNLNMDWCILPYNDNMITIYLKMKRVVNNEN